MTYSAEIPALPENLFHNHCVLLFDLTSFQDAGENVHYPVLVGESIRLEFFSDRSQKNVTDLIALGERVSAVKNDQFGTVAKNICEFLFYRKFFYIFFSLSWVLH